jgi:cellobiose phosphorylase
MINPVNHARDAEATAIYKVEPYVLAADVYAVAPHVGRGGWTWYTGSAGWMYRLLVESLLGLRRTGDRLALKPCLPPEWDRYELRYRHGRSTYLIEVMQSEARVPGLRLDGREQPGMDFPLLDDGAVHRVQACWPRGAA